MQPGLAAVLACLQAAQTVQTLSAAVLLSCTVPIAPDSCGAPAAAGPTAAAAAVAPAAALPSASPAAVTGKRPRQQCTQPTTREQSAGSGGGGHQPAVPDEQPGGSSTKRDAKEERLRQQQDRRAAGKATRKQQQPQQPGGDGGEAGEQRPQQQQWQHRLLQAEQEADRHLEQAAGEPVPGAPAAAEPQAAALARAAAGTQAAGASGASGAAAAPALSPQLRGGPDLYRYWSPVEAERLVRCVDEPRVRRQLLGSGAMDWAAIAAHFRRSVQAVRSKYRHEQVLKGDEGSGQRHRGGSARKAISYGYMALWGLASLPDRSGTGEEVCAAVEAHGPFQPLLDRSCRLDSAGVPKWRQRIREELSHRSYFMHTGHKRGGESVWRLDSSNFDSMPAAHRSRLAAQQLPGLPLLGKHG